MSSLMHKVMQYDDSLCNIILLVYGTQLVRRAYCIYSNLISQSYRNLCGLFYVMKNIITKLAFRNIYLGYGVLYIEIEHVIFSLNLKLDFIITYND